MNNPVAYMQVLINPATPYAAYMRGELVQHWFR